MSTGRSRPHARQKGNPATSAKYRDTLKCPSSARKQRRSVTSALMMKNHNNQTGTHEDKPSAGLEATNSHTQQPLVPLQQQLLPQNHSALHTWNQAARRAKTQVGKSPISHHLPTQFTTSQRHHQQPPPPQQATVTSPSTTSHSRSLQIQV